MMLKLSSVLEVAEHLSRKRFHFTYKTYVRQLIPKLRCEILGKALI